MAATPHEDHGLCTTSATLSMPATYSPDADANSIGRGLDLSSVFTTDRAGATRIVPWDMGAYEFIAGTDTTPPSAPANLRLASLSYNLASLAWDASIDDTGVTGYFIEHCAGAGCANFAQVGAPAGLGFSDTGLLVSTPYTWRVRATDAATNLSSYSNTLTSVTDTVKFHPTLNLRRVVYEEEWVR